ncbi:4-alpha-glucanotransferase [Alteromonas sp. 14N.309.X.WAT.G.H12]|uniref:4-alpha-glucanotransferase n=1 Tax=Alteromonas sp. 14N.309.X.WAT.G.H12 TaxID=3120824 RepID=UPI002FCED912
MTNSALQQLVEMRGIETHYFDAWGKPETISESSQIKLLNALGYDTSSDSVIENRLHQEASKIWQSPLNPVQVVRQSDALPFLIRLPIELVTDTYTVVLSTEDGQSFNHTFTPVDENLINVAQLQDVEYHEYGVIMPQPVPLGYHQLTLYVEDDDEPLATMRLIVAPQACYTPKSIAEGQKLWGLSVQLYCLRSHTNWGIGDFTDLIQLAKKAGELGADFIGLNPIHALYPANPEVCSPYGPSSRRWLNFLYLDVTAMPCFDHESVQKLVTTTSFQQRIQAARDAEFVDYTEVAALKKEALGVLFDVYYAKYLTKKTKQNKAFKAFVQAGGESLNMLAVYDTMQEFLSQNGQPAWGWPVFPDGFGEYHSDDVAAFAKEHKKRVTFYLFLQWQAALQLEAASLAAKDAGMALGLYRDLAVGVSEGSAEIWGNKDLYCVNASVGAPPDVLGPLGQNWGLPPMDPIKLYEQAYQPIIDLFSSNMAGGGALRIDHVMGLLRLWWVPKDADAKEGGYVYYPVDDLLGILALESHRQQSLVIGEDLGTVPEEIRAKLAENGIYSYRVFFFEQAPDGGFFSPAHYPVQSMSTLTTHDMPTLTGFWHCLDLELGKELGLYPTDAILQRLYGERHRDKQAILDSLHAHHSISDNISRDVNYTGMTTELNHGMQLHMARGSSALLSLQLEDWLQMDKPVNVPGTFNEYPNWRRKLSQPLEAIFENQDITALATNLTASRKRASTD